MSVRDRGYGSSVNTGILATLGLLMVPCCGPLGLVLSIMAVKTAGNDERQSAAKIIGIIGIVLNIIGTFCCLAGWFLTNNAATQMTPANY